MVLQQLSKMISEFLKTNLKKRILFCNTNIILTDNQIGIMPTKVSFLI